MLVRNALQKLQELSGQTATIDEHHRHMVEYKGYEISFFCNGRFDPDSDAIGFHTKKIGANDSALDDYYAGSFHTNLTKAFKYVDKATANEKNKPV